MYAIKYLLFIGLSSACYADEFFYRTDILEPGYVFERGFRSYGNNIDINRHVLGDFCLTRSLDSRFVSVTSDRTMALNRAQATIPWGNTFFIYRITPTMNFYNAYQSLMHAYQTSGNMQYRDTAETFVFEREWLAMSPQPYQAAIVNTQIIDAVQYQSRGPESTPLAGETIVNSAYTPQAGRPNPDPFIFLPSSVTDYGIHSACTVCINQTERSARDSANTASKKRSKWQACIGQIMAYLVN